MSSFFSSDGSFSLQFAIIFLVIFLILAGIVFAFRRLTGKGMTLSSKAGPRGRQPRLGIVDIYELDRQRQLILLRRDNVEHLLLVGGPNDVVIERNINRTMGARLPVEDLPDPDALPEPAAPVYEPKPAPYLEPTFEMPVVVPTPPPGPQAAPVSVARPLDDAAIGLPADPRVEPPTELEEAPAPRRAPSRLAGAIRRTPPSLVNLVPGAAAMRVRLSDEAESNGEEAPSRTEPAVEPVMPPQEAASARPETDVPPAVPPVVAPAAARTIDAAILSDMARQLEEALRRPAAAIRPSQPSRRESDVAPSVVEAPVREPVATAAHPEPETDHAVELKSAEPMASEPKSVDPIAAAMAAAPENPVASEHPAAAESDGLFEEREAEFVASDVPSVHAAPAPHFEASPYSETGPRSEAEPIRHEPSPPVFVETPPAPPAPAPAPPPPPAPSKPAQAAPNPFSVEEIEAEFARLLGRPLDRKN